MLGESVRTKMCSVSLRVQIARWRWACCLFLMLQTASAFPPTLRAGPTGPSLTLLESSCLLLKTRLPPPTSSTRECSTLHYPGGKRACAPPPPPPPPPAKEGEKCQEREEEKTEGEGEAKEEDRREKQRKRHFLTSINFREKQFGISGPREDPVSDPGRSPGE